jgi:hypothetical protein
MSVQLANSDNRVHFETSVVLTKHEAFEACETCADVERTLRLEGLIEEARRLSCLFDLIEGRLTGDE